MAKIGKTITAHTASGDDTDIVANDGFVINADDAIPIMLRGEATTASPVLKAGVHYPWDLKQYTLTGASAATVLWVIRGMDQ